MKGFHVRNTKGQKFNSFNPSALHSFLTNNVEGEKFMTYVS